MESRSHNTPDQFFNDTSFEMFPHEKVLHIISEVREAASKFTIVEKVRTEIETMPDDYKIKLLANLRIVCLQMENQDVCKYLTEILNSVSNKH